MTRELFEAQSPFYTDIEIAELLGVSLGRLRNKLSGGCLLPPRIQLPGSRRRLWPRDAVHQWLGQFLETDTTKRSPSARRVRPPSQTLKVRRR